MQQLTLHRHRHRRLCQQQLQWPARPIQLDGQQLMQQTAVSPLMKLPGGVARRSACGSASSWLGSNGSSSRTRMCLSESAHGRGSPLPWWTACLGHLQRTSSGPRAAALGGPGCGEWLSPTRRSCSGGRRWKPLCCAPLHPLFPSCARGEVSSDSTAPLQSCQL